MRIFRRALAALALAAVLVYGIVGQAWRLSPADRLALQAERFALRVDAILDHMEKPQFYASDLYPFWAYEAAPYFEYEGLVQGEVIVPSLEWNVGLNGADHIHLGGYTYCAGVVWLNIRYVNPVSVRYDDPDALAVLVHEMLHAQGGEFCDSDSERAESRTQLGMLETLAGMANHGNRVALYALLEELRSVALGTVWLQALRSGDESRYLDLSRRIYDGEPFEIARAEKSARYWSANRSTLLEILAKYEASVFEEILDFEFKVDIPGDATSARVPVQMDDLRYVLAHLSDFAQGRE